MTSQSNLKNLTKNCHHLTLTEQVLDCSCYFKTKWNLYIFLFVFLDVWMSVKYLWKFYFIHLHNNKERCCFFYGAECCCLTKRIIRWMLRSFLLSFEDSLISTCFHINISTRMKDIIPFEIFIAFCILFVDLLKWYKKYKSPSWFSRLVSSCLIVIEQHFFYIKFFLRTRTISTLSTWQGSRILKEDDCTAVCYYVL